MKFMILEVTDKGLPQVETLTRSLPNDVKILHTGPNGGVKFKQVGTDMTAHMAYATWFDEKSTSFNSNSDFEEYNWLFLRSMQNWCNDMLRARGYLFLNEVLGVLGLSHTSTGTIVGWAYDMGDPSYAMHVDFGCWEQEGNPRNADRPNDILLDFNVDGPIAHLLK